MPDDPSTTGVPTVPPVSPAQPNVPPVAPSAPSAADVSALLTQERRIRDLQSQADQKRAEAERLAAEKAQLESEMASMRANQQSMLDGAASIANQYAQRLQALETAVEGERADRMKAEALLSHPELKPYAKFIPSTTDPAKLEESIVAFKAARDQDPVMVQLQQQQQQQQQTPPTQPNPYALYPQGQFPPIPPAQPARPAANAGNAPEVAKTIDDKLAVALASGDPAAYMAAHEEAVRMYQATRQ